MTGRGTRFRPLEELRDLIRTALIVYAIGLPALVTVYALLICALGGGCRWP